MLGALLAIVAVTAASLALFSNGLNPSNYKTLHFALNFETEFLKRGLVGEAFRQVGFSPWGRAPGLFTGCVICCLTALYALASYAILRQRAHPVLAAILVALWASPAALPHLTADFGRLDAVLILLLGAWAACSYGLNATVSLILLIFAASASILVHEMALFVTAPLGFALWLIRYPEQASLMPATVFGGAVLCCFALTWTFGNADVLTPQDVTQMITQRFGGDDYSIELMQLVLFGDLSQNVTYSSRQAVRFSPLSEHLQFLGIMSGVLLLMGVLIAATARYLPQYRRVVVMACFAPLALYPFGYDYFRWLSFVLMNLTILTIWIMLHHPKATEAIIARCERWHRAIMGLALLVLLVGPVGVFTAFTLKKALVLRLILP